MIRKVSEAWPALGAPEGAADDELLQLLETGVNAAPAVGVGWMRREDGRRFRGEVSVTPLRDTAGMARGFAVVVRDLTTEQASEEFRTQAITTQEALQVEADALTDQLEGIQTVLDPELSDLPVQALLKELTGRLLTTLNVDGVAFVDTRQAANAVVFTAARGLQAQAKRGPRSVPRRLRIIQNDAAGVQTAMKKYVSRVEALSELPLPLISPVGRHTLTGWGASMYQYATADVGGL